MLRNAGVRWKILAVLALPVLVLVLAAGLISSAAFADARAAGQARQLAQAGDVGDLLSALQTERLGSVRNATDTGSKATLISLRRHTDEAVADLHSRISKADLGELSKQARDAVAGAEKLNRTLPRIRKQVDAGRWQQAASDYGDVISADLLVPTSIGDGLSQREAATDLAAFAALERVTEGASREQLYGFDVAKLGKASATQQSDIGLASGQRQSALSDFAAKAKPDQAARLAGISKVTRKFEAGHNALVGIAAPVDAHAWSSSVTSYVHAVRGVADEVAAVAATHAGERASSQQWQAVLTLLAALALLAASVLIALYQVRRIVGPLKHLTEVATRLRQELPAMVEQIALGHEATDLPQVDVQGEDEIGQLAAAFRDVNATAVEVAGQQVAMRAAVSETFINVARRNQVLLSRQLTFIDELERSEQNPEILDNLFRLDHLATRMRRNAESLLVLAGIEATRARKPMSLSDVIRTAISEIEHYDRVSLGLDADPPVMAHLSLSAAHLLAELVENATAFSDPDSIVDVEATEGPEGIRVTIRDSGIGMTPDELDQANAKLTTVPSSNALGSQRLGFFVVGQLANKLKATVHLSSAGKTGILAVVDLPVSLFMPDTLGHPPTVPVADSAPAEAKQQAAPPVSYPVGNPASSGLLSDLREISDQLGDVDAAQMPAFGKAADGPAVGLPRRGKPAPAPVAPAPVAPAPVAQPVAPAFPAFPAFPALEDAEPWTPEQAPATPGTSVPVPAPVPVPESWAEDRSSDYTGSPEAPDTAAPASRVATVVDVLPTKGGRAAKRKGNRIQPPAQGRRSPAQPDEPAAAARSGEPAAPAEAGPGPEQQAQLNRSALAAQALSELSQLSTYAPAQVAAAQAAAPLTRRRPGGGAASAEPPAPAGGLGTPTGVSFEDQESANRARSAAQVRSMLAGFQAGVSRGRSPAPPPPSPSNASTPPS